MKKDFSLVQRLDVIRELCSGKQVLHLGCTNYPYTSESLEKGTNLHVDLQGIAANLWGLDSDQTGLDLLASKGIRQLVRGNLEALENVTLDGDFDVILAGEMIEHLNNPGLFLSGVRRFMTPSTLLVITTINAYSGLRFLQYGLRGRGGRSEPVHPDHVAYYSYSTLSLLLSRHGLNVEHFLYYDIGSEHRPHNRWILNLINDVCVSVATQWADGIVAVCRLNGPTSNGS